MLTIRVMDPQRQQFDQLMVFIKEGQNDEAKLLLQGAEDLHITADDDGNTLLHQAAKHGNDVMVQHLLGCGALIDARNSRGNTPLVSAYYAKCMSTAKILLDSNANMNIPDASGKNILQKLVITIRQYEEMNRMLLKKLVEKCMFDKRQLASQLFAMKCPIRRAVLFEDHEVTELLMNIYMTTIGWVDIDGCDFGCTKAALHVAVERMDLENIKVLLEHGANVNARVAHRGSPPLAYLDLSISDKQKILDILKILLDHGAMPFINGHWQVDYVLREGNREMVRLLLQYGIDFNKRDVNDMAFLHLLAQNQCRDIFQELTGERFDVDIICRGFTALHFAVKNPSTVKFLLENGANVNTAVDAYKSTPLMQCMMKRDSSDENNILESINLLLYHGAIVNDHNVFKKIIWHKTWIFAEPLLAHLAAQESLGRLTIDQVLRKQICHFPQMRKHFELCKSQVDAMKTIELADSDTLYKLLFTATDEEIMRMYRRHPQVDLILKQMQQENVIDKYYLNVANRRLTEARLRAKSIDVFSEMFGLYYDAYPIVVDRIFYFLDREDMLNLCCAWDLNE